MALFPVGQGFLALRQSDQLLEKGETLQAARLRLQAAKGLYWQRDNLNEQAGRLAFQAQQPQFSIEILRPLYEHQHLSNAGKFVLSQAYVQIGCITVANQIRQELADSGYLSLILYPLLLENYQSTHQISAAIAVLQKLMELQPNNLFWHYRYGLILMTSQPLEAKEILKTVAINDSAYQNSINILLDPLEHSQIQDASYLLLQAGRGLASIGEWTLAEEAFQQAISIRPDYAEAWAYLGLAKFHNTHPEKGETIATDKGTSAQLADEGCYHLRRWLKDHSGLAEIRNALWLKPRSQVGLVFETQYWLERGYPRLALQSSAQAVKFYPTDKTVLEQYAIVLTQNGSLDTAWQVYHELLQNASDKTAAVKSLLNFDIQNNYQLWEEALPLARTLSYQNPDDAESLDLLAQVLFSLNYIERAKEIFERALRLDPNYAPAHLHLGMIYLQNGQTRLAITELQRAINLEPQSPIGLQAKRILQNYIP